MSDNFQLENKESGFEQNQEPNNLNKGQKIAVVVLAVFAVAVFGMWLVQFKKSISEPFTYKGKDAAGTHSNMPLQDSEESLKNKDTDGDGLSDWDELYFYKTSPYLEDSDSDGFSDKQEIDNDKDPNCPAGRDCYSVGIVDGDKSVVDAGEKEQDVSSLNSLLNQFNVDASESVQGTGGTAGLAPDKASDLEALFGSDMNAATLRQLLLEYGMNKEMLDKISDEQLMQSYREMMDH